MTKLRAADAARRQESAAGPDFSEALARGLQVITAFDRDSRQLTLSDVARAIDLPRATVRRALHTLQHLGYVAVESRLFRLTPRVLRLASAYLSADIPSAVIQPACERLMRATEEICSAAVLDGDDVTMITRALPAQLLQVGTGVGYRLPAFRSTPGRVLLAQLSPADLTAFLDRVEMDRATCFTITDRPRLRAEIERVGEQGYAYADQEAEYGFRSLAVPLRRFDDTVVAALHISARIERVAEEEMLGPHLALLRDTAADLKAQLI